MKPGKITEEGIPGVYSPEKVQQMLAEGMSEKFIQHLAREKVRRRKRLGKAKARRLAAQGQQQQGAAATSSKNHTYDTAEETMTAEISTSQRSKMETRKSQMRTETAKSQTRTETSKGQTKSDRTTASTASYTQM
uniref:Uncharacterized protein n=1 Tax=Romanomermis culicivorax TaxID=13658 RepID=A0A915JDR8_ROMCU